MKAKQRHPLWEICAGLVLTTGVIVVMNHLEYHLGIEAPAAHFLIGLGMGYQTQRVVQAFSRWLMRK